MKYAVWYHYIMVILFPVSGHAYINFNKGLYNRFTDEYVNIKTTRKVPFEYAVRYLIKHNMKMEKCEGSHEIFESTKKRIQC